MTVEEICKELEALKDFVNEHQKPRLDALKAAVKALPVISWKPVVQEPEAVGSKVEAPQEESKVEEKGFKPLNVPKSKRTYKRKSK